MFDIEGKGQLYRREIQTEDIDVLSMIANTLVVRYLTHNFVVVVISKNFVYSRSMHHLIIRVR